MSSISLVQQCLFIVWDIHRVLFPWTQRANKQEQVPCSAAQACLSREPCAQKKLCLLAFSQRLLLDLLLQPFSDSITNTFLWKVGELFLNPLTHSCNQSIAWPRLCQDLWGNPPPTQLGFCSSLTGKARCYSLITQGCVNCGYYLAHMCAEITLAGFSAAQEKKGVMNTLQCEVQIRHQTWHTQVDLSFRKDHVRTAQEFAADPLPKCISIFSSVAPGPSCWWPSSCRQPSRGCFLPLL